MSPEDLQTIRQQVPEVSDEYIQSTYQSCQGDVFETICQLLELPKQTVSTKTEWEERRDICDSYDSEIQKMMKGMRIQNDSKTEPLNVPIVIPESTPVTKKPRLDVSPTHLTISPMIQLAPKWPLGNVKQVTDRERQASDR